MKKITFYKQGEPIYHYGNVAKVIREKSGDLEVWERYEEHIIKTYWKPNEYDWFEIE